MVYGWVFHVKLPHLFVAEAPRCSSLVLSRRICCKAFGSVGCVSKCANGGQMSLALLVRKVVETTPRRGSWGGFVRRWKPIVPSVWNMVSLGHTEILYRKYARNKEFDWWLHLWEIISLTFDLTAMFMFFYIILLYIIFTSYTDTNRIWVRPEKRRVGFRKCIFFNAKVREHKIINHTVDGRNPAPVDKYSLSRYLQDFIHPRWCRISSINSINPFPPSITMVIVLVP